MWNRQLWLTGFLSQAHPSEDTTANTEYEATPYISASHQTELPPRIFYISYTWKKDGGEPGKVAAVIEKNAGVAWIRCEKSQRASLNLPELQKQMHRPAELEARMKSGETHDEGKMTMMEKSNLEN